MELLFCAFCASLGLNLASSEIALTSVVAAVAIKFDCLAGPFT